MFVSSPAQHSPAKGLEWCVLVALAFHALVLVWASEQGGRPGRSGAPSARVAAFHVRTINPQTPTGPTPVHSLESAALGQLSRRHADVATAVAHPGDARTTDREPAAVQDGEDGGDAYLPRSALSVPPRALDFVNVPYPSLSDDKGHYVVRLWLFIDETGVVQRATPDVGDAPIALVDGARQAFLTARFEPGQLEGRPVRSRLHVEVRFDTGTMPR
jgi:hypothetical protein